MIPWVESVWKEKTMRKSLAAVAAVALACSLGVAAPAPAAVEPYCGITWGSQAKTKNIHDDDAHVTGVRTGRHTCFDRMVVELDGRIEGYHVEYGPLDPGGSGQPKPLRGNADLAITVLAPGYYDGDFFDLSYDPEDWDNVADVDGYRTFRQVAYAGSFEGVSDFGLGVRERLPFRVLIADGPGNGSRLVIDVAHRW
jgi:hypothetical protein